MTSSASRSQASNVDDVLAKVCASLGPNTRFVCLKLYLTQLHALVAQSAASFITKSPTQEQRKRVASFQRADDARRRLQKDKRSTAKKGRSSKDWD